MAQRGMRHVGRAPRANVVAPLPVRNTFSLLDPSLFEAPDLKSNAGREQESAMGFVLYGMAGLLSKPEARPLHDRLAPWLHLIKTNQAVRTSLFDPELNLPGGIGALLGPEPNLANAFRELMPSPLVRFLMPNVFPILDSARLEVAYEFERRNISDRFTVPGAEATMASLHASIRLERAFVRALENETPNAHDHDLGVAREPMRVSTDEAERNRSAPLV